MSCEQLLARVTTVVPGVHFGPWRWSVGTPSTLQHWESAGIQGLGNGAQALLTKRLGERSKDIEGIECPILSHFRLAHDNTHASTASAMVKTNNPRCIPQSMPFKNGNHHCVRSPCICHLVWLSYGGLCASAHVHER